MVLHLCGTSLAGICAQTGHTKEAFCYRSYRHITDDISNDVLTELRTQLVTTIRQNEPQKTVWARPRKRERNNTGNYSCRKGLQFMKGH